MLDLLIMAKEAADTPARESLLDGLLEGNDNMVRRIMEEDHDHGELLDDDFFVPFIGLAAGMGDKHFWRVMGDWGYGFSSPIQMNRDDGRQAMSVGEWAAQFADVERLQYLIEEGLLEPFRSNGSGLSLPAGELGMLSQDDARFDFWLKQWTQHVQHARAKASSRATPNIPGVMGAMIELGRHGDPTPDGYPSASILGERVERLREAFLGAHYGGREHDKQWLAVVEKPPLSRHSQIAVGMIAYAASKANNPFADPTLLKRATDNRLYTLAAGLIEAGCPLEFGNDGQGGPAAYLLRWMKKNQNTEANAVWRAWLLRAKKEQSWVLSTLPAYLKNDQGDYQNWINHDASRTRRTIEAVSMSYEAGPASNTRSKPRF